MKYRYNNGFSLAEIMVTLAVTSILITVSVSSFQESIRDNRLTTQTNTFVAALQYMRSEAITRGVTVTIHKGRYKNWTGSFVNSGGNWIGEWEDGWEIFTDPDEDGDKDGSGPIRVGQNLPDIFTLRSNSNISNFIAYQPNGRSRGNGGLGTGSIVLCDDSDGNGTPESRTARMVILSSTGRLRIAEHSSDGIPKTGAADSTKITSCTPPFNP